MRVLRVCSVLPPQYIVFDSGEHEWQAPICCRSDEAQDCHSDSHEAFRDSDALAVRVDVQPDELAVRGSGHEDHLSLTMFFALLNLASPSGHSVHVFVSSAIMLNS